MFSRSAARPLCALIVAGCCIAAPSFAQPSSSTPSRADQLFEEGKALLDSGHVDEACVRLEESYQLEPLLNALGMLAWCHERQGRTATAWREYAQAAEMAKRQGDPERETVARERVSELDGRLSMLRIDVPMPVEGLVITRGGQIADSNSWGKPVPVDPGDLLILASAPGFQSWTKLVTVEGSRVNVIVEIPRLTAIATRAAPITPLLPSPQVVAEPAPSRPWKWPLTAAGIAVTGLTAGTYFGLQAWSKNNQSSQHCDAAQACDAVGGKLRDQAHSYAMAANVAFGLGAAAAAVGAVLWLRKPSPAASDRASVRVQPDLGVRSAGLRMEGTF